MNAILISSRRISSSQPKSHDVSEILDPTFTPGPSQEDKELFEAKQRFMYNVSQETLLTNNGRYIVRMHLRTTDAQAVWKDYSEYITTTYKGASEKRRQTPEEEDHHPCPKPFKYPTSYMDDGTVTMPDQRLVAVGGEEDHQPQPKTLKNTTSSADVGTPTKTDIPTVFMKSRHDDGPTSSKPLPEDPPQDVDKSHLSDSTSTTTNLSERFSLNTSSDHLLHLNSPSLSSKLQDTSIEFDSDFEEPMKGNKFSPTDVFSIQHDYDLFLLSQELHTPSDNLNHQDAHVCEKQGQDDYLIHATDPSHNFALPQFTTQHNYEDLKPIDLPESNPEFN